MKKYQVHTKVLNYQSNNSSPQCLIFYNSKTSSNWRNKEPQAAIKTTKAPAKLASQQKRGNSDTRVSSSKIESKYKANPI